MRTLFSAPTSFNLSLLEEELAALPYITEVNLVDKMIGVYHAAAILDNDQMVEIDEILKKHDGSAKSTVQQQAEALKSARVSIKTKLTALTWTPLTDEEADALFQ